MTFSSTKDSLPPDALLRVNEVCDRFEAACKAGGRPRIEDFLGATSQPERTLLLRELLILEWTYFGNDDVQISSALRRFPEHRQMIKALWEPGKGPFAGSAANHDPDRPTTETAAGLAAGRSSTPADADKNLLSMAQLSPGFQARYDVHEQAGRGAMGVVFRGRHRLLEQDVAIKLCFASHSLRRFRREAKLLAILRSPHVVSVHDFEELPDGRALLVMDWIDGDDLRRRMREQSGPLPESQVLPWMRQVCEAMMAAAACGIVHRDLKPSNILINTKGQAKVADFGLARSEDQEITLTGSMMGTPSYMAPEQAEDPSGVDTRADMYSFGATFYHALTGEPPFSGPTSFEIMYKHKTEPLVAPGFRNPALSEKTCEILERCLAKAPADRFFSFDDLHTHLQPGREPTSPWLDSNDQELGEYVSRYLKQKSLFLGGEREVNSTLEEFKFPRGQALKIVHGDITRQQVDAIVSSDTSGLFMDYGVSLAIANAGGDEVVKHARSLAPIRAGRVGVTTGGKLSRLVFHGVTVGWQGQVIVRPSRDLITEIMTDCFHHANAHDVHSIAFPLLGTGAQGFPRDICLDAMFLHVARTFLRGLSSVVDARIVLFD